MSPVRGATLLFSLAASPWLLADPLEADKPRSPGAERQSPALAVDSFDRQTLSLRGIDPQLAEYLKRTAGFTPGRQPVSLWVNGQQRGRVQVSFDGIGQLCIDPGLIRAAQLQSVDAAAEDCGAFIARYPQTQIELRPGTGEVELWVPPDAVIPSAPSLGNFTAGGVAGVFNYDLQGLFNRYNGQRSQFWSANTEAGFNAGDWAVRSRQLYTDSNGLARTQHLEAFAQRTFVDQQALFQAGQINLSNPVLAGARILGAQWMSEPALRQNENGSQLNGIAATQARVEVRQGGVLIYSTVVPAGPFTLRDIAQLDARRDAQLTVVEADGARRTVTITASSLGASLPASGFAFSAGRVRDIGELDSAPWVLSAGGSLPLSGTASLSNGALLADGYHALGTGLAWQMWPDSRWQTVVQAARALDAGVTGLQGSLSLNQQLAAGWAANLGFAQQSRGYRELTDTLLQDKSLLDTRYRYQYTLGLGWSQATLGSLNAGYAHSTLFDQRRTGRAYTAWSRQWGRTSLALNAEWQVAGQGGLGNAVYINASIPWGERRRVRASARSSHGQSRFGLGIDEQVDDRFSYRFGGERSSHAAPTDFNAGVSMLPGAAQIELGYARYGQGSQSYNLGIRGGMALHEQGLTLSPYALQDTFALLAVGEVPNVKVDTPGGPVWTDASGMAVIPQLAPFGRSAVEVATQTLPRNVDIQQGAAQLHAGRGSVPRLQFAAAITRRALLRTVSGTGDPLPSGVPVIGADGTLVTMVQEGGLVFIADVLQTPRLRVRLSEHDECELDFTLPDQADTAAYFETAPAVCRAS